MIILMCYDTNKSGTSAGVGFAIPSDVVSKIVSQLIAFGKVKLMFFEISFSYMETDLWK